MTLSYLMTFFQIIFSLLVVGFGQPAWFWWLCPIASVIGYALFWNFSQRLKPHLRFWTGTLWFTAVQFIQLSWGLSHPYSYIYGVYIFSSLFMGIQFGLLTLFITPKSLSRITNLLGLAGFWTIMEWIRLFILSGFSWNPVGLALVGTLYSLQTVSLWGVYGASFMVIFTNLLTLKLSEKRNQETAISRTILALWMIVGLFPYVYGYFHIRTHNPSEEEAPLTTVLVQTAFPVGKTFSFSHKEQFIHYVIGQWERIISTLEPHQGKKIDLVVLPENIVPLGTFYPVFPYSDVEQVFESVLGKEIVPLLPAKQSHLAMKVETLNGSEWMVNNAYWLQAIANIFQADTIAGLEDSEWDSSKEVAHFSSAFHFSPTQGIRGRYEKRVLVPMGEYIPFAFCRKLAAQYGIGSSFTSGIQAKVFQCNKTLAGISICYEETYGHKMRENRLLGAEVLVNITNDGWYPNSRLPRQHLEHARLRAVEMGIPLIRSCNTGVTTAIDSLGRTIKELAENEPAPEVSTSLFVEVPKFHYNTLYTKTGDWPIILLSFLFSILAFINIARNQAIDH